MGDIVHALPAVAALKRGQAGSHITWVVEPQWAALLEGNPFVDRVLLLRRGSGAGLLDSWRELRAQSYRFRGRFSGPAEIGRGGGCRPAETNLRLRACRAARARRGPLLFRQDSGFERPRGGPQSASWPRPPPDADTRRLASFRCRPAARKARCPRALSCWLRRWPDGAPSNGRWSIIARWPGGCGSS